MTDQLIADAEMGEEARAFLESDLGRCLLGLAQQQSQLALESLGEVDPTDAKTIAALQNKVQFAKSFEQWLRELLDDGNAAIAIYRDQNT